MSPGAVAIFGIAFVTLMYVVIGPLMLSAPRTGRKIKRWSRLDRALLEYGVYLLNTGFQWFDDVVTVNMKPYIPTDLWDSSFYWRSNTTTSIDDFLRAIDGGAYQMVA